MNCAKYDEILAIPFYDRKLREIEMMASHLKACRTCREKTESAELVDFGDVLRGHEKMLRSDPRTAKMVREAANGRVSLIVSMKADRILPKPLLEALAEQAVQRFEDQPAEAEKAVLCLPLQAIAGEHVDRIVAFAVRSSLPGKICVFVHRRIDAEKMPMFGEQIAAFLNLESN